MHLWRWVALGDVAIREVRVWAVHEIHVYAPDWTLFPLLGALWVIDENIVSLVNLQW